MVFAVVFDVLAVMVVIVVIVLVLVLVGGEDDCGAIYIYTPS